MPLIGTGIVAIWNDILPEKREDFFEWHPREHMQERMAIPGFLRGRRYIAVGTRGEEFLTLYEASEPELLVSPVYRERLKNPSKWSQAVLPSFRNNLRGVCRIVKSEGYGDGGYLLSVRYFGTDQATDEAIGNHLAALVEQPRVLGAHVLRCDQELSSGNAAFQLGRIISVPESILMIEASTLGALEEMALDLEPIFGGSGGKLVTEIYRLEYQVMNYSV